MDPSHPSLRHLVRSPRVKGAEPYPTLLLLHGRGADEADLLPLADDLDPRYFVVSARAPLPLGPGFAWYDLADIGDPEPSSFDLSLNALTRFVAGLPDAYPIDRSQISILGFSQGAVMAGSLLLTHPELAVGTVMLSGYLPLDQKLPIDETKLANRRVFVGHGTADPLIPVAWARRVRDYFTRVGANLSYREYPMTHAIGPDELDDVRTWGLGAATSP
ncbi:MAG: alpha/beta hydrolase [Chloroflexota bacterium]